MSSMCNILTEVLNRDVYLTEHQHRHWIKAVNRRDVGYKSNSSSESRGLLNIGKFNNEHEQLANVFAFGSSR